ncbi:MAG TPA: phosphoglucosamine mutase [Gemmatimonadales bacterium]|jgi:phosphomannomutase
MSDTLMISVSGMRGLVGTDLTPELVARHASALGAWVRRRGGSCVVLGRDARTSGPMFALAATAGFQSVGVDVIDVGVVPTPTVQMAVEYHHAGAGLIITASHNPIEWNALKFVGPDGIFLDAESGGEVRQLAESGPPRAGWDAIGMSRRDDGAIARHLDAILALPEIDVGAIRAAAFHVALDCVRGAGSPTMLALFDRLGVRVSGINLEPDGHFPREPEPIPENLGELGALVQRSGAALGMAVDPDVDRLALVDEAGRPIGEDYTLAIAARAVLGHATRAGTLPVVVANLSTSLVVADAVQQSGGRFVRAPVGEANVARAIVAEGAVLGGEGNGGVILPALHVGRDAPLGAALILQYLAQSGQALSAVVVGSPSYTIVKAKAARGGDLEAQYRRLEAAFPDAERDLRDGLRLGWADRWLHVRPSGTEPIVRLIAEAPTREAADDLVARARQI